MRSYPLPPLAGLLLAALLAGCGDAEALPDAAPHTAALAAGDVWSRLPPDSLYGATAPENLRVTPVVLDVERLPAGWEGMEIAAISDLQLGLWQDNERVATAATTHAASLGTDLIVLLGDYIHTGADTAALARVLEPLRGKQVFAVLGDRDVRTDSLKAAITRTLTAAGVRVLDDGAIALTRNGSTAYVAGVDPELAGKGWGDQEYILATLGGGAATPLLLTHNPALASRISNDKYQAVLAGNTFCGRVEVPGTPRLSWLNSEALPGAAVREVPRLYRVRGATMYVTCGVGYSFVPLRVGAPPEIALVTLQSPAAEAEPAAAPRDSLPPDSVIERFQGGPDTTVAADTAG